MKWPHIATAAVLTLTGCLPSYELDGEPGGLADASAQDGMGSDAGVIGVVGEACEQANELACAGHAQKLVLYCNPTTLTWTALQSCSGQQLCDTRPGVSQGSCQDAVPECIGLQPGDRVCHGTTSIVCGPDLVTSEQTQCENACVQGSCAGTCATGTRSCSGTTPQVCDAAGAWKLEAPCAFACTGAGQCSGQCVPGSKECTGQVPQACNADGQWESGAACQKVCSFGVCEDACVQGQKQCNGKLVQTCNSGVWGDGQECGYLCSGGECMGQCVPNSKQCSGQTPQTCDAQGAWQSGEACQYVCEGGQCKGVCAPGSHDCLGLEPRSCDGQGQWEAGTACEFACAAGVCTGECAPGAKQCSGQIPQTCEGGEWQSGAACTYVCTAGTCSGGCTPGTTQCSGNKVQTCQSSGQWNAGTACPYVCASGACAGVCTPGEKQCSGNKVQTCQANSNWDSGIACSGTTPECSGGQCMESCDYLEDHHNGLCAAAMVTVTGGYAIDVTEVTRSQYARWLDRSPPTSGQPSQCTWNTEYTPACDWPPESFGSYPVACVDWCDAFAYCAGVGKRLCGKIGGGMSSFNDYAMSSESQWYAACSAGGQYDYPYGNTFNESACNAGYHGSSGEAESVASHPECRTSASGYAGIYDLCGNVWEWEDSCNGTTPTSNCRVRGAGNYILEFDLRCSADAQGNRDERYADTGFRCCSSP